MSCNHGGAGLRVVFAKPNHRIGQPGRHRSPGRQGRLIRPHNRLNHRIRQTSAARQMNFSLHTGAAIGRNRSTQARDMVAQRRHLAVRIKEFENLPVARQQTKIRRRNVACFIQRDADAFLRK